MLRVFFVFVVVCTFGAVLADNWAVEIPEGVERAEKIANEHGLINGGEIIPDSKVFHFRTSRRRKCRMR